MRLEPGTCSAQSGNLAWTYVNERGDLVKQFFVLATGQSTLSFDIDVMLGHPLTDDELRDIRVEIERQFPTREFGWPPRIFCADDTVVTLMRACAMAGMMPSPPFRSAQDFEAWLLQQGASSLVDVQRQQLVMIKKAIDKAVARRAKAARCIQEVLRLGEVSGIRSY